MIRVVAAATTVDDKKFAAPTTSEESVMPAAPKSTAKHSMSSSGGQFMAATLIEIKWFANSEAQTDINTASAPGSCAPLRTS